MESRRASRYLLALAAMIVAGFVLITGAVAIVNPFGLMPLAPTIPGFNTTKVARNERDRLIKRYDPVTLRPKTVIVGTSRVKFAFDPEKVSSSFAPAYNAGIDALLISEARQLLEGYLRDGIPIKHVFFELFLFQFFHSWPGRQQENLIGNHNTITDLLSTTMSGGAVRAAMETISASRASGIIATQKNGFRPIARPHNGVGFVPPQWLASFRKDVESSSKERILAPESPISLLWDEAFTDLAKIVELCNAHNIDLKFFIGPLHPVFAYMQGKVLLHEWLRRISTMPQVISFLTAPEFRDYELTRPKLYYTDYSHMSFAATDLIIDDLMAYPNLRYGRVLNSNTLPEIIAEWDNQLSAWTKLNADFVRGNNTEFAR
jgi:hypothetical protein